MTNMRLCLGGTQPDFLLLAEAAGPLVNFNAIEAQVHSQGSVWPVEDGAEALLFHLQMDS